MPQDRAQHARHSPKFRLRAAFALAVAASIGPWLGLAAATPASAVENEEYTQTYVNRSPSGTKNEPEIWFVYARAGETVTVQAGASNDSGPSWENHRERAFYTITAPDGALVQTNESEGGFPEPTPARELGASMSEPDTQPAAFVVPEGGDGIYRVALRPSSQQWNLGSFPWRMLVSDAGGAELPGRVWVETYRMVETWPSPGMSVAELEGLTLDYWFVSEQGYQYELALDGFVGWNSVIEASLLGNTDENCVSQYHSLDDVTAINTECNDKYNTFFEKPAADLPATAAIAARDASVWEPAVGTAEMWITPPVEDPVAAVHGFQSSAAPAPPKAGSLSYSLANFAGNYAILIDADGDGSTDGPLDRKIPLSLTRGMHPDATTAQLSYDFDGLDAAGDPIPASVTAGISILIEHFPELHFVFGDVEQLAGGLSLTRVNGGGDPAADKVYWNDSMPADEPGGERRLLGEQACGPSDALPSANDPRNPIVNTDGMQNVAESPALRYWGTDLGNTWLTQSCRDENSSVTGSYGNEKLLDTWSYADVSVTSSAQIVGPSLHVVKAAQGETAIAATPLGYTVTATNNGSVDLTEAAGSSAVVKDDLGGKTPAADSLVARIDGAETNPPTLVDGTLTWVGDLPIGASVEISYALAVAPDGSSGTEIVNQAAALRTAGDPLPSPEACAAAAERSSFNCTTVAAPIAAGPALSGKSQAVAPSHSVSFDVLGKLAKPGASADLSVSFLDPATGKPVAGHRVEVRGGVWSLDPATGIVTFTAGADFDGTTPDLQLRVTDGNGFTADAKLTVTLADDGTTPPLPPKPPVTPTPETPKPNAPLAATGAADTALWVALGIALMGAGGLSLLSRRRARG